jgi:hypothetical protein
MELGMLAKILLAAACALSVFVAAPANAQSFDRAEVELFQELRRQDTDLERYAYLIKVMPRMSKTGQSVVMQLLASTETELGLYDQAVFGFPLRIRDVPNLALPTATDWQAVGAADAIAKAATGRRIVMVNEAHYDAHTRELTLSLLPRLKSLGFNYFAVEALGEKDPGLTKRGYPVKASGSEYLREPLYGDMLREAIKLGFIIVPYDTDSTSTQSREIGQAENLYAKVFSKNPLARLFVHAGFAHIDKDKERLGDVEPMAAHLEKLTGITPLSIDQTQFLELSGNKSDTYHRLIDEFKPDRPEVLINRATGAFWSAEPKLYDVNVILPASLSMKAFGATYQQQSTRNESDMARISGDSMITPVSMDRPLWLTLGGLRRPVAIDATLCRSNFPCVVDAHYADESDEASSADRYVFLAPYATSRLFLRPGKYRVQASSVDGSSLSNQVIDVAGQ